MWFSNLFAARRALHKNCNPWLFKSVAARRKLKTVICKEQSWQFEPLKEWLVKKQTGISNLTWKKYPAEKKKTKFEPPKNNSPTIKIRTTDNPTFLLFRGVLAAKMCRACDARYAIRDATQSFRRAMREPCPRACNQHYTCHTSSGLLSVEVLLIDGRQTGFDTRSQNDAVEV